MSDNKTVDNAALTDIACATVEGSWSGDTVDAQGFVPMVSSGSEGSRTLALAPGDATNGYLVQQVAKTARLTQTSAGLTTATTAYSIGDQLGNEFSLASAVRVSGGSGYITSVAIEDLQDVIGAIDAVFFRDTGTPAADNAAFNVSTTDILKFVDVVQLAPFDLGATRVAKASNLRVPYDCAATTLYCWLLTRSAHTFFAGGATQLRLVVQVEQN